MSKFRKVNLNIRPALLDKLLGEFLSGHAPSIASVSEAVKISKATASKVAHALVKSEFMCEKIFSKPDERPSSHFLFEDKASILLIDLSSSIYKMSIVNPNGRILFSSSYTYDSTTSLNDNLNIFISRNGLKVKNSNLDFAAISVMYADENRRRQLEVQERTSHLPPILLREYIEDLIHTVLGKRVSIHITVSDAVSEAVKFKTLEIDTTKNGISSVFIGSHISAFHIYSGGSATVCSPENMLSGEEIHDLCNINLISKEKADRLFVHISDFMDCAFSPSVLLLESDVLLPDIETAEKISRRLTLTNRPAPLIYTRDNSFPLYYIGIARSTLLPIVKKYIASDKL